MRAGGPAEGRGQCGQAQPCPPHASPRSLRAQQGCSAGHQPQRRYGFDLFLTSGTFTAAFSSRGTDCCLFARGTPSSSSSEANPGHVEGRRTSSYKNYISLSALQGAEAEDTVWPRRWRAAQKAAWSTFKAGSPSGLLRLLLGWGSTPRGEPREPRGRLDPDVCEMLNPGQQHLLHLLVPGEQNQTSALFKPLLRPVTPRQRSTLIPDRNARFPSESKRRLTDPCSGSSKA